MTKPNSPSPAAGRQKVLDVMDRFRRGEATAAEMKAAARELNQQTRQMNAALRLAKAEFQLQQVAAGRGRPALPPEEAMAPVSIYMKPSQREKLQRLGGAAWVRQRIDRAKEPTE